MTTTTTPALRPARTPRSPRPAVLAVSVYASLADSGLYRFRWCPGRQLVGTIHLPRRARRWLRSMTASQAIEAASIGERGMRVQWGDDERIGGDGA